jgi:aspartate/glutamate racemase
MANLTHIGILGGFGPLPTAELYTSLCALIKPRPYIVINSPSVSKNAERGLVNWSKDKDTRDIILYAFESLQNNNVDIIAIPSLTVMSLIQEEGIIDERLPDWFSIISNAVIQLSSRRIGIVATRAVLNHSSLVANLREIGIDIVSAKDTQTIFEEWVLACDDPQKAVPPPPSMLEVMGSLFIDASVDTCLLACTEACLYESCFKALTVSTLNSLTMLIDSIVKKAQLS